MKGDGSSGDLKTDCQISHNVKKFTRGLLWVKNTLLSKSPNRFITHSSIVISFTTSSLITKFDDPMRLLANERSNDHTESLLSNTPSYNVLTAFHSYLFIYIPSAFSNLWLKNRNRPNLNECNSNDNSGVPVLHNDNNLQILCHGNDLISGRLYHNLPRLWNLLSPNLSTTPTYTEYTLTPDQLHNTSYT